MEKMRDLTEEELKRKSLFIARATSHFDNPRIRREASDMWDKVNIKNIEDEQ